MCCIIHISYYIYCCIHFLRLSLYKLAKLGGLKQWKFILSSFWGPEVWNQGISRPIFLLKTIGRVFLAFSSFWWLLRGPWLVDSLLPSLFQSYHGVLSVCLSVFTWLSYKDTCHWGQGPYYSSMTSTNYIYKTLYLSKVTF